MIINKILVFARSCLLDGSDGAAVSGLALARAVARWGFAVEALCGPVIGTGEEVDPADWLAARGYEAEAVGGDSWSAGALGVRADMPPHFRLDLDGVPVTIHRGPTTRPHEADEDEGCAFFRLLDATIDRLRPDVLVGSGGDRLARAVFAHARARGLRTVFHLHNFLDTDPAAFADADAVLVPSRFAADYYREALGLDCAVLPNPVDWGRVRVERPEPKYLTFVNPSVEKGVYAFARIADELGRRRPDIPILVVEGRGTEQTVAACGLDLRAHGNVFFLADTPDPRKFWRVTRACLMPSLWWESQGMAAVEAMVNGLPVVASDRGALPEMLGGAGIPLPLPDRLTPATRWLPTAEEVAPWVEAVIRLWDDEDFYQEHCRRSREQARRWAPEVLGPEYARFFEGLSRRPAPPIIQPPGRAKAVVLVPHLNGIDWPCEQSLRKLEEAGVRVVRREGSSQIDLARNELISDALHDGFESILFIDADIGFGPLDALRLLARPEPVVGGVYAKKGRRELASRFADGIDEVVLGAGAFGLYPLKYAATGFLRIKAGVLRRMVAELGLPLCNTRWGRGCWPFFQPYWVPDGEGGQHYLGEDWAFSDRLARIGVTPMADTSIRLWHFGRYGFGWEDAGADPARHRTYTYRIAPTA